MFFAAASSTPRAQHIILAGNDTNLAIDELSPGIGLTRDQIDWLQMGLNEFGSDRISSSLSIFLS